MVGWWWGDEFEMGLVCWEEGVEGWDAGENWWKWGLGGSAVVDMLV